MWPFKCNRCPELEEMLQTSASLISFHKANANLEDLKWNSLGNISGFPPVNTNLLVANKDFTYFGFLYYEDGWDYSRKINMQGNGQVWATYTNAESIAWWLNLDLIKKS